MAVPGTLHGYLVVDKPAGWTSFDVVARVRRLVGEKRVGHAGTLDPAATGVLPVAVGAATKTLEFLNDATKTYRAAVTFGVATDSHDGDGRVTAIADASGLTAEAVAALLPPFRGAQAQIPPMHAAIKIDGQRLYELARRGEVIERAPRPVVIHELALEEWTPPTATLRVDCSKGTYVRALARDLGDAAGTGAYLSGLVRLRSGPFHLRDAMTLDQLAAASLPATWADLAVPPDAPLRHLPAIVLTDEQVRWWRQGRSIPMAEVGDATPHPAGTGGDLAEGMVGETRGAGHCRAYDAAGTWLGVGEATADGTAWHPSKVVDVGPATPSAIVDAAGVGA